MKCSKCNSGEKVKNGILKGVQRYRCKKCGYNYTVEKRSGEYSKETKRKALQLYLEGLGFRSIGRILGVSNVSVLNWVRGFGEKVKELQANNTSIEFAELDEMHSYIGNKKTIVGFGLLLIDLERDSPTSLLAIEATKPP
ncbi:Transposase and inactivated derivatives [hydrothermal vent metagenome]|uniref:Transposase and inactivated derivatives n=1 Tax=hydrothermal vent metagenome TaxID=652676 RepID=A0A3B0TTS9_9ZZZZ